MSAAAKLSCNSCDWTGPVSESVMLGSVGPLCPLCRETTEPDAVAPSDAEIMALADKHGEQKFSGSWSFPDQSDLIDFARALLSRQPSTPPKQPVAWVRRHPDGMLTAEFLDDAVIEPMRKNSGAWVPLFAATP
ncbi:MAG: hypothetical protein JWR21_922 [Herminiimonas sp.]|nr:hypothetical protein [Herminiimonas sp.]